LGHEGVQVRFKPGVIGIKESILYTFDIKDKKKFTQIEVGRTPEERLSKYIWNYCAQGEILVDLVTCWTEAETGWQTYS
jgi:hypothetical protein